MSHYTPEEIEKYAELKEADGLVIVADMLRDYAANLRQHGQQEEGAVFPELLADHVIKCLTDFGRKIDQRLHEDLTMAFRAAKPLYTRPAAHARVPDGWVLVPREPTPGMLAAVAGMEISVRVAEDDTAEYPVPADDCAEIYRNMLAAAPSAESGAPVPNDAGAVADVVTHNGLTYGKLRHDLPNGTQLFTRPAARVHTEQVEEGAVAWCEPDVIEQMSPMARWDGVDAIECVLLREQTENHTVPLYTRPAARARVPKIPKIMAYPLWKAIYAASKKSGHPCTVGLAQVSMALEAMEYHGI